MEYPFGQHTHSSHHHHQRNDQEEEEERPPHFFAPPPSYNTENEFDAPPPPQRPYHHQNEFDAPPPPPRPYHHQNEFSAPPPPPRPVPYYQETEYAPPPPPPPTQVTHVHHGSDQQEFNSFNYQPPSQVSHVSHQEEIPNHSFRPHLPSFLHHHSSSGSDLSGRPTVKVYCKAQTNFSLTIRDNKVLLAPSDSSDDFQHWYRDERFSTRVKDAEGFPSFALVNKATGLALKHSIGDTHPLQLKPYNPDVLDESILWTESKDLGDSYRAVRMVNNIRLNWDAFNGQKQHGGVHDGTTVVLWQWKKGDNQRWKIAPYWHMIFKVQGKEIRTISSGQKNSALT